MAVFQNQDVGQAILQGAQVLNGAIQFQQQMMVKQQQFEENFKLKEENLRQEVQNERLKAQQAQIQLQINQTNAQAASLNAQASQLRAKKAAEGPSDLEVRAKEAQIDLDRARAADLRQPKLKDGRKVRSQTEKQRGTEFFMRQHLTTEEAVGELGQVLAENPDTATVQPDQLLSAYGAIALDPRAMNSEVEAIQKQMPDPNILVRAMSAEGTPQDQPIFKQARETAKRVKGQIAGIRALQRYANEKSIWAATDPDAQRIGVKGTTDLPDEAIDLVLGNERKAEADNVVARNMGLTSGDLDPVWEAAGQKNLRPLAAQIIRGGTTRENKQAWMKAARDQYGVQWVIDNWKAVEAEIQRQTGE